MDTSEQVLIIILVVFLVLYLSMQTLILVKINQVLNSIKRITEKAENVADKAEAVGEFLQKAATTTAIGKLLNNFVHGVKANGKNEESKDEGQN